MFLCAIYKFSLLLLSCQVGIHRPSLDFIFGGGGGGGLSVLFFLFSFWKDGCCYARGLSCVKITVYFCWCQCFVIQTKPSCFVTAQALVFLLVSKFSDTAEVKTGEWCSSSFFWCTVSSFNILKTLPLLMHTGLFLVFPVSHLALTLITRIG